MQADGHVIVLMLHGQKSPLGKYLQAQGRPGERLGFAQLRRHRPQQREIAGGEAGLRYRVLQKAPCGGELIPRRQQAAGVPYYLTGGLCENTSVVERLAALLGSPVTTSPQARFAGAIGAAIRAQALM